MGTKTSGLKIVGQHIETAHRPTSVTILEDEAGMTGFDTAQSACCPNCRKRIWIASNVTPAVGLNQVIVPSETPSTGTPPWHPDTWAGVSISSDADDFDIEYNKDELQGFEESGTW